MSAHVKLCTMTGNYSCSYYKYTNHSVAACCNINSVYNAVLSYYTYIAMCLFVNDVYLCMVFIIKYKDVL